MTGVRDRKRMLSQFFFGEGWGVSIQYSVQSLSSRLVVGLRGFWTGSPAGGRNSFYTLLPARRFPRRPDVVCPGARPIVETAEGRNERDQHHRDGRMARPKDGGLGYPDRRAPVRAERGVPGLRHAARHHDGLEDESRNGRARGLPESRSPLLLPRRPDSLAGDHRRADAGLGVGPHPRSIRGGAERLSASGAPPEWLDSCLQ